MLGQIGNERAFVEYLSLHDHGLSQRRARELADRRPGEPRDPLCVLVQDLDCPDICFPHAASDNAYLAASKDHSLPVEKMFAEVFPTYGNLVSASIPVGMDMALKAGRLKRGHNVVFCPASAVMECSAVKFVCWNAPPAYFPGGR